MAPDPKPTRIAIKLGPPSSTTQPANRNTRSLGKQPPRRSVAPLGKSDSDSDPDDQTPSRNGRQEEITGFGVDGAEIKTDGRQNGLAGHGPRIIERLSDSGWIASVKQRRRGEPATGRSVATSQPTKDVAVVDPAVIGGAENEPIKWGLVLNPKRNDASSSRVERNGPEPDRTTAVDHNAADSPEGPLDRPPLPIVPKSLDDEAMDALLDARGEARPSAVIKPSEEDLFRHAVRSAADVSTLEDYEAMPVEEFGAALLRGMGWNGDPGPAPKEVVKRPKGLGLGAKELKEAEDLGGWNQNAGSKKHRPRLHDYRREEEKRKEERAGQDSYKREREREQEQERDPHRHRGQDREKDRERARYGDRRRGDEHDLGRDRRSYRHRD